MKNIFKFLFFVGLLFTSCEDAYNVEPDDEILESNAITSVADLEKAAIGLYGTVSGTNLIAYSSRFTDDLRLPADNRGQGVQDHTWDINSGSNSPTGIWFNLYNVINRANRILNIIDGIPAQTTSEELQKDRIKAECLGLRALSHFDLLRSFGVSYDGDSSELGVPNIDYVVVLQQPSRNTVAENYNFINADINAALGLLDVSYTDNTRLTVNALNALQARVALYQGDYATAISAASQVISNVPLATATEYPDIWTDASENEVVFKLKRTTGDGAVGTLFQDTNGDVFFSMSNDLLFRLLATSAADPRFGVCLDLATATIAVPTIGKYLGTAANFGLNDIKVFRTSEMVCIRSEAYARIGELALSSADMNLLGVNRGYLGDGSFATTAEALSIIEDVRRIELAFEGHRYYDMRRYGKSIDRTPTDDCGAASGACQLPATDHRWVMPIPQDEIFANDNITQNPGY
tara:strand:+ start:2815 stop:4206 length:1392 start_codon:yes stop_codon:yes gene_type:complete